MRFFVWIRSIRSNWTGFCLWIWPCERRLLNAIQFHAKFIQQQQQKIQIRNVLSIYAFVFWWSANLELLFPFLLAIRISFSLHFVLWSFCWLFHCVFISPHAALSPRIGSYLSLSPSIFVFLSIAPIKFITIYIIFLATLFFLFCFMTFADHSPRRCHLINRTASQCSSLKLNLHELNANKPNMPDQWERIHADDRYQSHFFFYSISFHCDRVVCVYTNNRSQIFWLMRWLMTWWALFESHLHAIFPLISSLAHENHLRLNATNSIAVNEMQTTDRPGRPISNLHFFDVILHCSVC